jgi:mannose-1-phosphate guanylyltransferase
MAASMTNELLRLRTSVNEVGAQTRPATWAIVLAGGQGVRLRSLVRQICGDDRPKQFARIIGSKSLLGHTLDRVRLKIPAARTVVVACQSHSEYMAQEFSGPQSPRVLLQPEDRGTATGILYPALRIYEQDPGAIVAVFPSDHFILEGSEFMAHVLEIAAFVADHPDRLVLMGAQPSAPEPEYGWIEPGEALSQTAAPLVHRVHRFWEKPAAEQARSLMANGCLWNTFVFIAKVSTLLEAGRMFLPQLTESLKRAASTGPHSAIEQAFAAAPPADFSRAVLERCPPFLAVSPLRSLTWSDLGTPERVLQSLQFEEC